MSRLLIFAIAALSLSVLTFHRNTVWENDLTLWEDCIEKAGGKGRAYRVLADALQKENKWEAAILNYKKSAELEPASSLTFNNLGVTYEKTGLFDQAEDLYRKTLKLSPGYPDALNNLGNLNMKLNRIEEAIRYFSLAAQGKKKPDYYYNLGTAYMTKGMWEEALFWIKKALVIEDELPQAHCNLGIIYFYHKNSPEEAVAEFKRSLEIDPDFMESHVNLGILYHSVYKDQKAALLHLKRSLELTRDPSKLNLIRDLIKELKYGIQN